MGRWSLLGVIVMLASMLAVPATVLGEDFTIDPQSVEEPIAQFWARADGPDAQADNSNWLWGPGIRSAAREPYVESPDASRRVYYFDKARMEINDPARDWQSDWYATAGLLVRDMIVGQIQVGDNTFIETTPAEVPLTGDIFGNLETPTYATLEPLVSYGEAAATRRAEPRTGQQVTALLESDGSIQPDAVANSDVTIDRYEEALGHNVPGIFVDWIENQAADGLFVVGHALIEPYWVDTRVGGVNKRVLVQAFERRILTYTPDNPEDWQVEAGNTGLHYRAWRGLSVPQDADNLRLAREIPYGEIIADASVRYGIDPYLLAAVAETASQYNPLAFTSNGGRGLFGVRADLIAGQSYPLVPENNAALAASELVRLHRITSDWRAVLAWYYSGSSDPNWDDEALNSFVNGVLEAQARIPVDLIPPEPESEVSAQQLNWLGHGAAAYYSPSYTIEWWHDVIARHAAWGNAVPDWERDPNGYYCVHPDYRPGQRLHLTANGVSLWCTIGDTVNPDHVSMWRSRWAVELSWHTFTALGLDRNNWVEVRYP